MANRTSQSLSAEAAFRERLADLGAQLLEPEWLGTNQRHHVRCSAGHECYPRPHNVLRGWGFCKTCAGKDPAIAEAKFRVRLAELGCTPLYEEYRGRRQGHHVRCVVGHVCYPSPASLQQGHGPCLICAKRDSATAEAAFRSRLAEVGGTLLGPYRGATRKHHVRCAVGHDCHPRPADVAQGVGICWACSGRAPAVAEAKFRARLREIAAVPLYEEWRGVDHALHVRCAAGHDCYPLPGNVNSGQGVCLACAGQAHTVFYVLGHEAKPIVKFGISSHDGRARMRKHRMGGYTKPHLLVTELPEGVARRAEDAVRAALGAAGERPVRGREYFDVSCLALILDVAGSWLSAGGTAPADGEPVREWIQDALFAA
jgi:hypothetical protein